MTSRLGTGKSLPIFLQCRYRISILTFFYFCRTLASLAYSESAPRFFNYIWGFYVVNISTMWDDILYKSRKRKKMLLKFLACLKKISVCILSLCDKWVKSCPTPVNISTTWKKNLSILDRMPWAKNYLTLLSHFWTVVQYKKRKIAPLLHIHSNTPTYHPQFSSTVTRWVILSV